MQADLVELLSPAEEDEGVRLGARWACAHEAKVSRLDPRVPAREPLREGKDESRWIACSDAPDRGPICAKVCLMTQRWSRPAQRPLTSRLTECSPGSWPVRAG